VNNGSFQKVYSEPEVQALLKEKDAEIQRLTDENKHLHYLEEDADAHRSQVERELKTVIERDVKLADELKDIQGRYVTSFEEHKAIEKCVGLLRGEKS